LAKKNTAKQTNPTTKKKKDGDIFVDDDLANEIVSSLNQEYGSITNNVDDRLSNIKGWISSGCSVLDSIITNNPDLDGSIPVGRLTSIVGDHSTGKSLLGYMILADCQKKGGVPILIDTENSAPDWERMKSIGINPPPPYGTGTFLTPVALTVEGVFSHIEHIIKKVREVQPDRLITIVWDSVAATPTNFETDRQYEEVEKPGVQAAAISRCLKKIISPIANYKVALVFLNQTRVDLKANPMFGQNESYPGGKAIPFYSSLILRLSNGGQIKAGMDIIGNKIKVTVKKNRLAPPKRDCFFNVYYTRGVIDEENWPEYLVQKDIVKKDGRSCLYTFEGKEYKFPQKGIDFVDWIRKDEEDIKKLRVHFQKELKRAFYLEPDPFKRDEEFSLDSNDTSEW